jgi:4-amino-4-deoxychorismate lyase
MAKLFINGEEAQVDAQNFHHFHGTSVFTTLRSHHGAPVMWSRHWQRLVTHAQFFGFRVPSENRLQKIIADNLLTATSDQKIRLLISPHGYALTLEDLQLIDEAIYQGVATITAKVRVHSDLAWLKTANSLPYTLARQEAQTEGAFEGLLLNHKGFLVDGSRTSLMLYHDNQLFGLQGGLMGTMRDEVFSEAQKWGLSTSWAFLKPSQLRGQLLLANSLLGVVPVGAPCCETVVKLVANYKKGINNDALKPKFF